MSYPEAVILPLDMISEQLAMVDLFLSMFYGEGEIIVSDPAALDALREHVDSGDIPADASLPTSIDLELNIEVAPAHILELHMRIPFIRTQVGRTSTQGAFDADEPPKPVYSLRCPSWLTRKEHAELVATMPIADPDGVLGVVQYLKDTALTPLATADADVPHNNTTTTAAVQVSKKQPQPTEPLVRVWFYLQSLSTRSKRLDLVNWAPSYSLTGFVLAGKPGILCLEGTSADISAYMSEIKTRSWSDVPAYQKKVSERCREEGKEVVRKFVDMREVTDEIGKGGKRGNRGEMAEVRALFESVGLEDMFEVVVGFGGGGG